MAKFILLTVVHNLYARSSYCEVWNSFFGGYQTTAHFKYSRSDFTYVSTRENIIESYIDSVSNLWHCSTWVRLIEKRHFVRYFQFGNMRVSDPCRGLWTLSNSVDKIGLKFQVFVLVTIKTTIFLEYVSFVWYIFIDTKIRYVPTRLNGVNSTKVFIIFWENLFWKHGFKRRAIWNDVL